MDDLQKRVFEAVERQVQSDPSLPGILSALEKINWEASYRLKTRAFHLYEAFAYATMAATDFEDVPVGIPNPKGLLRQMTAYHLAKASGDSSMGFAAYAQRQLANKMVGGEDETVLRQYIDLLGIKTVR